MLQILAISYFGTICPKQQGLIKNVLHERNLATFEKLASKFQQVAVKMNLFHFPRCFDFPIRGQNRRCKYSKRKKERSLISGTQAILFSLD